MTSINPSDTTLLLIHGLGATSGVWADVVDELGWPGPVLTPDLPGHGRSAWTGDYTVGALAGAISGDVDGDEPVLVVGHSLGGAVGLCLASGFFRPNVVATIGIGIKVAWTDDEVTMMAGVAGKGVRYFDSKEEAVARFLRTAGLDGLVEPNHPSTEHAVVHDGDGWRMSQDPLTFAQRRLPSARLMAAADCPVVLGAGENDTMVTADQLAVHVREPRIASGCGHNVQVEDPAWVVKLISSVV